MRLFYHETYPYNQLISLIDQSKIVMNHLEVIHDNLKTVKRDHFKIVTDHFMIVNY